MYWVKIITWEFWAGKTYNVFYEAYKRKLSKENPFIISNIPYSWVDLVYTWIEDLQKVFKVLVEYAQNTNDKDTLNEYWKFRPIIFILDEAHLYFFSRWFSKNFNKEQLIILTQVRKRKISMYLITQELAQLDSTFRRLVPAVRKYYKGLGWYRRWTDYYFKKDDTDVKDENIADKTWGWFLAGGFLAPAIKATLAKWFNLKTKDFFDDYWTSYFITWFWKNIDDEFDLEKFMDLVYWQNENETKTNNTWNDKTEKKK